ncbi:hypothetical protein [Embleya sp. NPDC001921]
MSKHAVRRRVRRAALPLSALVLVAGLSACEFGSEDAKTAEPKATSAQPGKPGDTTPSAGGSSDPKPVDDKSTAPKPPRSGTPAGDTPATKAQLAAALLTAQELPAGMSVKDTTEPRNRDVPTVSDPKCQPLLGQGKTSVATIEHKLIGGTGPRGVVYPDTDIVLSSYPTEQLDRQWSAYLTAAKTCKRFTFRVDGGTAEYSVLGARPDAYGPGSIEISSMLRLGQDTAPMTQAVARVGTTVVQLRATGEDNTTTVPTFADHLVQGQIDKVRSELRG